MKTLILLFLLSFNINAYEISVSPLTIHTITRSMYYYNSITEGGELIANPILSIGDRSKTFLIGKDSSGFTMVGGYYQKPSNWIFGAYTHYKLGWDRKKDYSWHLPVTKNFGLIPIIGYKQIIPIRNNSNLHIIYTPLVINLSFSYTFN